MKKRNMHIDIAKGIGILLVVFGHNYLVSNHKGELFNIIFSFHVPLFFFLSGLFFNPSRSLSYTAVTKIDSILKPYFVTLFLLGFVYAVFKDINLPTYIFGVIYGNGLNIYWIPMWFLTHLFAVTIFSWFVIYGFEKLELNKTIRYMILCSLLIIGVRLVKLFWIKDVLFFGHNYTLPGLPFSIDILFITSFYFLIGYSLKGYFLNFNPSLSTNLLTLSAFIICHIYFDKTIDLNLRTYNGIILSTIEALSGIYLTLSISYLLQFRTIIARIFAYIGESSLFILIFHFYIQPKTFFMAKYVLGENSIIAAIFSFILGVIIPMAMFWIVKKVNIFSIFFIPIKHNRLFQKRTKFKTNSKMSTAAPILKRIYLKNRFKDIWGA